MKLYQMIFSPTGGTRKAAEYLSAAWDCEKEEINLLDPKVMLREYVFTPEDICLAAVPSFGGRVPGFAAEKLKQARGNGAKAILLVAYGNRAYEDTFAELEDVLAEAGFCCAAGAAALAEHSIVHTFAAGRPDAEDEKKLYEFGGRIREKLETQEKAGEKVTLAVFPGNRPYKAYGGVPMKPKAGKSCTGCGICARECPVGAISPDDLKNVRKDLCISCMHCIAVCPEEARMLDKLLVFGAEQKMKKACEGRKKNELFL